MQGSSPALKSQKYPDAQSALLSQSIILQSAEQPCHDSALSISQWPSPHKAEVGLHVWLRQTFDPQSEFSSHVSQLASLLMQILSHLVESQSELTSTPTLKGGDSVELLA